MAKDALPQATNSSPTSISVTDFKAKCLGFFKDTSENGTEFIVTKKGQPIAKITPFKAKKNPVKTRCGSMAGLMHITGDIVYFDTSDLWDALKE